MLTGDSQSSVASGIDTVGFNTLLAQVVGLDLTEQEVADTFKVSDTRGRQIAIRLDDMR